MNILVTGAQGFIGRYLVARLLQNPEVESIVGVGRSTEDSETFSQSLSWCGESVKAPIPGSLRSQLDDQRFRDQPLDLTDTDSVKVLFKKAGIQSVVHLAGALRDSVFNDLMVNNIGATQSLLTVIEKVNPKGRLILGSSGSVYGKSASIPAKETDRCEPLDQYAVSKLASENFARVSSCRSGFTLAVARIFNVVGPGLDERHLASHLARQFAEQRLSAHPTRISVGPLTSSRDYIDVRDVANGLARLLFNFDTKGEGTFNLASGVELKTQFIYDELSSLSSNSRSEVDRLAARQLDIDRAYADISRLRSLGFRCEYSLSDSLEALLNYYLVEVSAACKALSPN